MSTTAITGAQVFDGEKPLGVTTVVIQGGRIVQVGGQTPAEAEVVDGAGATLLPGLPDRRARPRRPRLPRTGPAVRRYHRTGDAGRQHPQPARRDQRGRLCRRRALLGLRPDPARRAPRRTVPEGLPPGQARWRRPGGEHRGEPPYRPDATSPEAAAASIPQLIAHGSDYVKFMIDDGSVEGHPGLPKSTRPP